MSKKSSQPFLKKFQRYTSQQKLIATLVVIVVAGIGLYFLVSSHAAAPYATSEAESGSLSSSATKVPSTSASGGNFVQSTNNNNTTLNVSTLLSNFTPGTAHEALPHGVPTDYSWEAQSTGPQITPPAPTSNFLNWWGQLYVDTTDIHAANVVVEIDNCQLWTLANGSSTWQDVQGSGDGWGGGNYSEDFTSSGANLSFSTGPDSGSITTVPLEGNLAHFWGAQGLVNGSNLQAAIIICRTRVILANASGPDNRATSHYILDVGADWRESNYGCPDNSAGQTACSGIGVGKFIKVTSSWRDAIYSSLSKAQLSTMPLPPASIFVLPDGTYPGPSG